MINLKLVSSNEFKLKEFMRFGLNELVIEKGRDLKEVDSDPQTVILYKSLEAGVGRVVEDTSLHIEGEEIGANVKWLIDNLHQFAGKKATWRVLLGVNDGEQIKIYEGLIEGTIEKRFDQLLGFGFDSLFVPVGSDVTLYELELENKKDLFSARKNAIESFLGDTSISKFAIQSIPKWTGQYQSS